MKRYLVTGASSGLGLAVCKALAGHDVQIAAMGRSEEKLERELGDLVAYRLPIDLASEAHDLSGMVRAMGAECGGLDGIFHCAGEETTNPLRGASLASWHRAMIPARSAFEILRGAAGTGTMKPGASIVLMSSVAAHRGVPGMAAYSAGKAAVEGLMRSAAVELAPRVRVNAVAAGAFRSPMHARITRRMPQASADAYELAHPLGFGDIEAVRDVVLHLLSPASRWVTGTVQVVDGGYLAR